MVLKKSEKNLNWSQYVLFIKDQITFLTFWRLLFSSLYLFFKDSTFVILFPPLLYTLRSLYLSDMQLSKLKLFEC